MYNNIIMLDNNLLKIDEESKVIIQEVSALSGYSQSVVKEIVEYFLINWTVKIADNPDDFADLVIPYLGKVRVKYSGDRLMPSGEITTDVIIETILSPGFRKLIGDLHDEAETEVEDVLRQKIDTSVLIASSD